jgi:hypothetical protein
MMKIGNLLLQGLDILNAIRRAEAACLPLQEMARRQRRIAMLLDSQEGARRTVVLDSEGNIVGRTCPMHGGYHPGEPACPRCVVLGTSP